MITILKNYLNIIIAVLSALLTFYFSHLYYSNKIDKVNSEYSNYRLTTEKNIETQKASILSQQNNLKDENLALNNKLKDLENEKYKQYQELQKVNSDLKSSIANGSKRLYINASCPSTTNNQSGKTEDNSTSPVVNGSTSKAVIDSRDATAIISITEKADKYKSQLEGLQSWINELILDNNK